MTWRAASIDDYWYVVDDSDESQPVACCPRGEATARDIAQLRAEVERLKRDRDAHRDLHDNVRQCLEKQNAEVERLRAALERIRDADPKDGQCSHCVADAALRGEEG